MVGVFQQQAAQQTIDAEVARLASVGAPLDDAMLEAESREQISSESARDYRDLSQAIDMLDNK